MMRRKEDEIPERQVSLWLEKNGPYQRYQNLSAYLKGVLRNLVCTPTRPTTARERQDLYMELCLPDIARESIDPAVFVPEDEKLREFFSPVDTSETLPYWKMF